MVCTPLTFACLICYFWKLCFESRLNFPLKVITRTELRVLWGCLIKCIWMLGLESWCPDWYELFRYWTNLSVFTNASVLSWPIVSLASVSRLECGWWVPCSILFPYWMKGIWKKWAWFVTVKTPEVLAGFTAIIVSTNSAKGGRILFWFMKD